MKDKFKQEIFSKDVTDIHIKGFDVQGSVIYSKHEADLSIFLEDLSKELIRQDESNNDKDFLFEYMGITFRGAVVTTIKGKLYTLRRVKDPVDIDKLDLKANVKSSLLSRSLRRGGIVLITGQPGSGKTTVCVSTIIKRLERFGGVCFTVEDPPEIKFQGSHGDSGLCYQTDVGVLGSFKETIINLLRAYPTREVGSMFIGEIRDSGSAEQALMSALDGRLVFATMHSGTVIDAIKRIIALSSKEIGREVALEMLAKSLKVCVNQKFKDGKLEQTFIATNTSISSLIANGKIEQLSSEVERQSAK
jgi:twitching motility protein PilT